MLNMDLIWMLEGDVLSRLRRALQPLGSGKGTQMHITLEAFVCEVSRVVSLADKNEYRPGAHGARIQSEARRLIERACILFDLVDIDSVGVVDWVELTDFCVFIRGGGSGDHRRPSGEDPGASAMGAERDHDGEVTRYSEKLGYVDRSSHCHEIRSMRFVKELDVLVVIEGTPILKVYAPGPKKIGQIEPAIEMRKITIDQNRRSARLKAKTSKTRVGNAAQTKATAIGGRGNEDNMAVLAAEFIGRGNQLLVSCADGHLTAWELDTYKMLRHTRMKNVQVGLRFCPSMDILTSWGVDEFNHDILVWDMDTLKVIQVISGHSGPVKDVREVAPSDVAEAYWDPMLVTASMDGRVITWDLRLEGDGKRKQPKKLFILMGHYHGVLSLAYSDEHDLIISAGFDFEANCWDRSTSHISMKLAGHRHSLIGVEVVTHETQRAVTGDDGGSFRVWDIRRGHSDHGTCLQAFSLRNTRASPRTMVVTWRGGLVVAGSKMHVFRATRTVAVGVAPGGAWFSSYTGELCVLLRKAEFLDASTGRVKRHICQQPPGCEITAFCLDARHKKAVIGTQKGALHLHDAVTGRWVMSATPHRSEVAALLFVDGDDAFASAGWDRKIQVHDASVRASKTTHAWTERSPAAAATRQESACRSDRRAPVLRSVEEAHDGDITHMVVSLQLGLLATASNDLTIRVWDYSLLRLEEILVGHRQEITCICFLDPVPSLATTDAGGKVLIWATRPHQSAWSILVVLRNTVVIGDNMCPSAVRSVARARALRKVHPTPVTAIAFHHTIGSSVRTTSQRGYGAPLPEACTLYGDTSSARECRPAVSGHIASSWDACSTLLTGDELGSIKRWDITEVLIQKLGRAACCVSSTVDPAMLAPGKDGKKSHHFVHHRHGPMDGVRLQAAARFRELIELAKEIRGGDYFPSAQPQSVRGTSRRYSRRTAPFRTLRKVASVDVSDDRSSSSGKKSSGSSVTCTGAANKMDGTESRLSGLSTKSPLITLQASSETSQLKRPPGAREELEGKLNTPVDDIEPSVCWKGHSDAVTFIKVLVDPKVMLTGSLDSSVRLFSPNGKLLGVVVDENQPGTAPWLFCPPPEGRTKEAIKRAELLERQMKILRLQEKDALHRSVPHGEGANTDEHDRTLSQKHSEWIGEAPANGSTLPPALPATPEHTRLPSENERAASILPEGLARQRATNGIRSLEEGGVQARSALSAICLSQIRNVEPTHVAVLETSEASSESDVDIDVRLQAEARDGSVHHSKRDGHAPQSPTHGRENSNGSGRRKPSPGEAFPTHKTSSNLLIEQEKKMKRTRSALTFLSESIARTKGDLTDSALLLTSPSPEGCKATARQDAPAALRGAGRGLRPQSSSVTRARGPPIRSPTEQTRDDLSIEMRASTSAPTLRRAVATIAPVMALRLGTHGSTAMRRLGSSELALESLATGAGRPLTLTQRSGATAALITSRSNVSLRSEFARRRVADRRRKRIDGILDAVRKIRQCEGDGTTSWDGFAEGTRSSGVTSDARDDQPCPVEGSPPVAGDGYTGATVLISARVQQVLTRFEACASDKDDPRDAPHAPRSGETISRDKPSGGKTQEVRLAARKAAIKQNERYLRAQRFDLMALQETQQRRQEATVGLTGPSGERFGPYSLDDVLEFHAFAGHLHSQAADSLTVRELMANPGVQADLYAQALLQELVRSRVFQWNQALSVNDLLQLVFHFAKREELGRIVRILDLILLLERIKHAHMLGGGSLLGNDRALSHHITSDIDMTVRTSADACGTYTVKELYAVMSRVGSDLFPSDMEDLEAFAVQCGVTDSVREHGWLAPQILVRSYRLRVLKSSSNKELTAADLTAIVTKIAVAHRCRGSGGDQVP